MRKFEEEWRLRFQKFATCYHEDHLISGWSDSGLRRRLSIFKEIIEKRNPELKSRMLDLGCGGGTYVRYLSSQGYNAIGMDYSLISLSRAREADMEKVGSYLGGEAYNLPFTNECFDVVVSIGVLQALDDPKRAIDEMVRVLKPNGTIVVEFLNALEFFALGKCAFDKLTGRPARVHTFSPYKVIKWFGARKMRVIKKAGVFLLPRSLHTLGRVFDNKRVVDFLEKIPGVSLTCAHAFLIVGKK